MNKMFGIHSSSLILHIKFNFDFKSLNHFKLLIKQNRFRTNVSNNNILIDLVQIITNIAGNVA